MTLTPMATLPIVVEETTWWTVQGPYVPACLSVPTLIVCHSIGYVMDMLIVLEEPTKRNVILWHARVNDYHMIDIISLDMIWQKKTWYVMTWHRVIWYHKVYIISHRIVLCHVISYHPAMQLNKTWYHATPRHAMPRHATPRRTVLYRTAPHHTTPHHTTPHNTTQHSAKQRNAINTMNVCHALFMQDFFVAGMKCVVFDRRTYVTGN